MSDHGKPVPLPEAVQAAIDIATAFAPIADEQRAGMRLAVGACCEIAMREQARRDAEICEQLDAENENCAMPATYCSDSIRKAAGVE